VANGLPERAGPFLKSVNSFFLAVINGKVDSKRINKRDSSFALFVKIMVEKAAKKRKFTRSVGLSKIF